MVKQQIEDIIVKTQNDVISLKEMVTEFQQNIDVHKEWIKEKEATIAEWKKVLKGLK